MNYYLIGTGHMAHFIAARMSAGGHTCAGYWGRDRDRALVIAKRFHLPLVPTLQTLMDGPDVCLMAVSDAAIPAIAGELSFRETTLLHFAGTVPMDALMPAPRRAVLWPVYSIAAGTERVHRNIPCAWNASTPESEVAVAQIASALGGSLHRLDDKGRKQLHLAAVFGNNFTNHILAIAEQLCRENEIPFFLLLPLIQQTLERVATSSPRAVQTGPAKRRDVSTMDAHRELLAQHPDWQSVYNAISSSIERMYRSE